MSLTSSEAITSLTSLTSNKKISESRIIVKNMASKERGPNLIRKYVWVLETIHRAKEKGITFNELNEKWMEDDISGGVQLI